MGLQCKIQKKTPTFLGTKIQDFLFRNSVSNKKENDCP